MKRSMSRPSVIAFAFFIISAVCLSSAVGPSAGSRADARAASQRAGCVAAVSRVQKALTAEAHAYGSAKRTACQFASLPPESRAGKPQALNDMARQNLDEARQETSAAYKAAAGCNTSGVKRPEVSEHSAKGSIDAYNSCAFRARLRFLQSRNQAELDAQSEVCTRLLDSLDCEGIRVAEENRQPEIEVDEAAFVPNNIEPECREAYLQFKAAEKEQTLARKRVADLAPNFGAAGPRGKAMFDRAREESERAGQKRNAARQKLKACQAVSEGDEAESGTGEAKSEIQDTQNRVRPCDANERAAFAKMLGSWRSISLGPNMTISGSCEQATGTEKYAEYCERPDATYNTTLKRYDVKFTGRMDGESLQVAWTPVSTDSNSRTGAGSCRVSPDGTLSCSGIPCGINAKKQ